MPPTWAIFTADSIASICAFLSHNMPHAIYFLLAGILLVLIEIMHKQPVDLHFHGDVKIVPKDDQNP